MKKEKDNINKFVEEDEFIHEMSSPLRNRYCSKCGHIVEKIYSLDLPPYYCKQCKKYLSSKEVFG